MGQGSLKKQYQNYQNVWYQKLKTTEFDQNNQFGPKGGQKTINFVQKTINFNQNNNGAAGGAPGALPRPGVVVFVQKRTFLDKN